MEPTTALSRVEAVLQASETGLFLHQIAREAHVNEKEAKEAIKALNARAQIETIPTPGRWGSRYAWLAAKNPLPKVAPLQRPPARLKPAWTLRLSRRRPLVPARKARRNKPPPSMTKAKKYGRRSGSKLLASRQPAGP